MFTVGGLPHHRYGLLERHNRFLLIGLTHYLDTTASRLAETPDEGGTHFQLLFDVRTAHRRVSVLEEEWGRQACQVKGSAAATA